jgi:hypothetical protein
VAIDAFALTGADLEALTSENNLHTTTKFYPGIDSDIGCGSNSRYTVTWSIVRIPVLPIPISPVGVNIKNFAKTIPGGRAL